MTTGKTNLARCRPGEGGRVARVACEGRIAQRLSEMGVVEGTEVRVVRVAPLGDPIEVELMGYLLSLRKAEAGAVELEVAS